MLPKCGVIWIIFLKTISSDILLPGVRSTNIKKVLDSMNNPLTNRVQLINKTGRYLNEYNVVTNDQYILKVFRLTYENNETTSYKYPVLLVHGLFQCSDIFLQQRENQSLAFKLQDFGYDVWLANFRGNKYGRRHTSFGPETKDKAKFFNYTYEEIALQDIAATVNFILENTKHEKIHYIGYSLGGTVFLVLNSMKPEYNNKFDTAHLFAPIGYQNYFPNKDLRVEANRYDEIYENLLKAGAQEIFPYDSSNKDILFSAEQCLGSDNYRNICSLLKINEIMGIQNQDNNINETRGGSIKQLVHLAQNIKSKSFSRWDYGEKINEDYYGTKEPPKYNLSLITVKTNIIFDPTDEYVSPKDIADMAVNMSYTTTIALKREGGVSRYSDDGIKEIGRKGSGDTSTNISSTTPRVSGIVATISSNSNVTLKEIKPEDSTDKGHITTKTVDENANNSITTYTNSTVTREVNVQNVTDMTTDISDTITTEAYWKSIKNMTTNIANTTLKEIKPEEGDTTDKGDISRKAVEKNGNSNITTYTDSTVTREVDVQNVNDTRTDISDTKTTQLYWKGITNMPTNVANTSLQNEEIGEVTSMTNVGDFAKKKIGREGNADVPTHTSNFILREGKKNVTNVTRDVEKNEGKTDFKHKDFIDAPDVMELVYDKIINDLETRSNHTVSIGRQNEIDNSEHTTDISTTVGSESEDKVKEKLLKTNWHIIALIPGLMLFGLLIFICFVKYIHFNCHMEI
ncbi:uncharacterized protein LOC125225745 [Leguminivora glycinivorella]|uniref:uncharacterized protein LOC125225745 n=1 Tax=Leguminivora glycinivorella TaxID=1035111 RepID=UPI00200DD871|nr:uncharacterized protein LOC125225745 [Leguminivora glycinivorella]